jgi:hypothetical protein
MFNFVFVLPHVKYISRIARLEALSPALERSTAALLTYSGLPRPFLDTLQPHLWLQKHSG